MRIVLPILRGLSDRFDFRVLFLDGGKGPLSRRLRKLGFSVRGIVWSRRNASVNGPVRYVRAIREAEPDLVHAHTGGRSLLWLTRLACRAPIVCHLYSRLPGRRSSIPREIPLSEADLVVSVSHSIARLVEGSEVIVIHPGVEPCSADGRPGSKQTVIGVASRLVREKGHIHLLRALSNFRDSPDVRLEITGTGAEREKLVDEVDLIGLSDRVRFLGWVSNIREVMLRWDVFVHPSLEDAFPMSVLEAMACGLPVVATNVGDIERVVDDENCGYIVKPGDEVALTEKLKRLVLDESLRKTMGESARERARRHFTMSRMIGDIAGVYERLLGEKKNGAS